MYAHPISDRSLTSSHIPAGRGVRRPHPAWCQAGKPACQAATKFSFVIDVKAAKALGIDVGISLLLNADDYIE